MNIELNYKRVELSIEYDYTPFEPSNLEYPGIEENLLIESIEHKGDDIVPLISTKDFVAIEQIILKLIREKWKQS